MDDSLPYQLRNADKRAICRNCEAMIYHVEADGYMATGWFAVENGDTNVFCPKPTTQYSWTHKPDRIKGIVKLT